jgi:hypothetical protein
VRPPRNQFQEKIFFYKKKAYFLWRLTKFIFGEKYTKALWTI